MSARKRGRITVQSQPTKETRFAQRLATLPFLIVSIFFVIIGVTFVIPNAGLFGVVWTLIAVCFVVIGIYSMVRKNGLAHRVGYDVETDLDQSIVGVMEDVVESSDQPAASVEDRLTRLRSLYEQRLITQEEYDAKRQEILDQL